MSRTSFLPLPHTPTSTHLLLGHQVCLWMGVAVNPKHVTKADKNSPPPPQSSAPAYASHAGATAYAEIDDFDDFEIAEFSTAEELKSANGVAEPKTSPPPSLAPAAGPAPSTDLSRSSKPAEQAAMSTASTPAHGSSHIDVARALVGEAAVDEAAGIVLVPIADEACQLCGRADDEHLMLLCDSCNLGFHTTCLNPPLPCIPDGDWLCPSCADKPAQQLELEAVKRELAAVKRERDNLRKVAASWG